MPEISVIVPVYKVEDTLPKCIESIITQSYSDWELILINDGSPDSSGEICEYYKVQDSRIKVFHTPNQGVSAARNIGIEKAKGDYIVFIDSDDWVEKSYLWNLIRRKKGQKSIVFGNVINDYDDNRASNIVFNYQDNIMIALRESPALMTKFRIPENGFPIAKLFSNAIIQKNNLRFDTSLSYHEDHLFVFDYLCHVDEIILSSSADYHYIHRYGVESLSKKKHKTENLIKASKSLSNALENANLIWGIKDKKYLKQIYTFLGLNQLIMSLFNASQDELPMVYQAIKHAYPRFRQYYKPGHNILKIVPFMIANNLSILLTPILRWREKFI